MRPPATFRKTAIAVALWGAAALPALAGPSPFGVATPDSSGVTIGTGPFAQILLWAIRMQTQLYKGLTDALSDMASGGQAAEWLLALSFLYGIFHAVGPGHGKAVVSAYLFATGDRLKRGVALSFAAAFVQALSAIAIVSVAAILLNVTAVTMTRVTGLVEIASYASITALGVVLLVSRLRLAFDRRPFAASGRYVCEEVPAGSIEMPASTAMPIVHGRNCACVEAARLAGMDSNGNWKSYASAIVSVGIRPCSGALIVLVFALSQDLFAAGVLSVFAMAVGTGLTVALVALLSVTARGLLMRSVAGNGGAMTVVSKGVQVAAAALFLLFGATMTLGALAASGLL